MREFPAMETHILDKSLDAQPHVPTFDGPLGRAIIETHIWAVHEGLSGATARDLFDGYCQRLVVHGVPLWRAHTAMETLHPQWGGYGYTWRRDLNAIQPEQYARSEITGQTG
jgi:adenylate cyclase